MVVVRPRSMFSAMFAASMTMFSCSPVIAMHERSYQKHRAVSFVQVQVKEFFQGSESHSGLPGFSSCFEKSMTGSLK
ncbi:hypothetical protein V6N13_064578 [Hibiscus sabdariffa]|uniref:Secreted protein n=1 Tax=Hibiscus sabdariffa TaxID=183260 RepID=A0ABR2ECA2_9ROSI